MTNPTTGEPIGSDDMDAVRTEEGSSSGGAHERRQSNQSYTDEKHEEQIEEKERV